MAFPIRAPLRRGWPLRAERTGRTLPRHVCVAATACGTACGEIPKLFWAAEQDSGIRRVPA